MTISESDELRRKPYPSPPPAVTQIERRVLDLDEIEGSDLALVGGKAFRLAQLRTYGLTVPPGLVLTTTFFETQIVLSKLTPLWSGSPDVAVTAEALGWLADSLKLKPLAKTLATELEVKMRLKFDGDTDSFAVRSSVIDEDQRDHSFAGMHLTELGVPRSALPIAITRCWASALSGPAVNYRQLHGLSIQRIRIALLIQPMLTPECSGVAFSINPLTGARDEIVIEATWGLANELVSGNIQPYFYRVANQPPDYPVVEQRAGSPPPDKAATASRSNEPLTARQIADLAQHLEQIQALLGEPQDVEWAFQDDGFSILQSRPITSRPQSESLPNFQWSRSSYFQSLPDLPSPLLGAFLESAQPQMTRHLNGLGIKLDQAAVCEKVILGRPYFNLTLTKSILTQLGLTSGAFLYLLGDPHAKPNAAVFTVDWKKAWAARSLYRAIFKQSHATANELPQLLRSLERAMTTSHPPEPDTPSSQLLAELRRQVQQYGQIKTSQLSLLLGQIVWTGLGSKLLAPTSTDPISEVMALASANVRSNWDRLQHPDASSLQGFSRATFWRKWLVSRIVNKVSVFLNKQEELHQILAEFITAVRAWHLALGQRWSAKGWLDNAEDIFWLTLEEIERIFKVEEGITVSLPSTVEARKATYNVYAQTDLPLVIKDAEIATIQFSSRAAGDKTSTTDVVIGQPISPGQVRGTIVVVRQPAHYQQVADDEILVMPSTDPDWLALVGSAAGLIVETGGLLSHGSVIAREYGLPAVANIPEATRRFQTGDKVLVDGSTGVIQLL